MSEPSYKVLTKCSEISRTLASKCACTRMYYKVLHCNPKCERCGTSYVWLELGRPTRKKATCKFMIMSRWARGGREKRDLKNRSVEGGYTKMWYIDQLARRYDMKCQQIVQAIRATAFIIQDITLKLAIGRKKHILDPPTRTKSQLALRYVQ